MSRHSLALALLFAWNVSGQEIHLKTRTIRTGGNEPAGQGGGHQILQFDHAPSVEDLDRLLADGNTLVSALPDNAVLVNSPGGGVLAREGVRWMGALDQADKISPEIGVSDSVTAVVEFHSDVSADVQEEVAAQEGIALVRSTVLLPNHAIVTASTDELRALAAHDEVGYVFPADPDLIGGSGLSACAGMLTASGPVAQFANIIHGWDPDADHAVHLGYVFGSITPKVPADTVRGEIVRALNEWSKITNVLFQPGSSASAPRTVYVKFASGAHGDAYPFDGPGGVLAHTFYPVPVNPESIAGDMHLDADENWHLGSDLDIYSVALHEAGHAIGLGHSDKPGDVMYPYYRSGMHLSANDIGAAQALYGMPAASAAVTVAPVTSSVAPLRLTIDASTATTSSSQTSLSGAFAGGTAPVTVQWQTDRGYSGHAAVNGSGWNAPVIPLVYGANTITVTAFDNARQTASQTVLVTLAQPAVVNAPVSLTIATPSSNVITSGAATLSIGGTSTGTRVTWQTSAGASGTATGTTHWLIPAVPLFTGTNTIVIRAYDGAGNSTWAAISAVRR